MWHVDFEHGLWDSRPAVGVVCDGASPNRSVSGYAPGRRSARRVRGALCRPEDQLIRLGKEGFYWLTLLVTFALGTAAGDWTLELTGWGPGPSVLLPAALITAVWVAWKLGAGPVLSFWLAYILTRPLGANIGDFLGSARGDGGLGLARSPPAPSSSPRSSRSSSTSPRPKRIRPRPSTTARRTSTRCAYHPRDPRAQQ